MITFIVGKNMGPMEGRGRKNNNNNSTFIKNKTVK